MTRSHQAVFRGLARGVGPPAGSSTPPEPPPGINLISDENSSFEGGTVGNWTGTGTRENSTEHAAVGTRSMKVSGVRWPECHLITPVTPGSYRISAQVYATGAQSAFAFGWTEFQTSAGAWTGEYRGAEPVAVPMQTWTRLTSEVIEAPAGTGRVDIQLSPDLGTIPLPMFLDDVRLEEA